MKRALRWIGIVLGSVIALALLIAAWTVYTEAGARFVLARAVGALGGRLAIESSNGTLGGALELHGVHWSDAGVDARIGRMKIRASLTALISRRIDVAELEVDDGVVALTTQPAPTPPPAPSDAFSLRAPVPIALHDLKVQRVVVRQDGADVLDLDSLAAAGGWTDDGMTLERLALRAKQGRVDASAKVGSLPGFPGEAKVDFEWRAGADTTAGAMTLRSDGTTLATHLELKQPLVARLDFDARQSGEWPWNATLTVPAFDAHAVLKTDAVKTLALDLAGSGTRAGGALKGHADIDAHRIVFDPLRVTRRDERTLVLDALHLTTPDLAGQLDLSGTIAYGAEPPSVDLDVAWQDVTLPADLVGQPLATHGTAKVSGSANAFGAKAALALGPPGRLAAIETELDGTPETITLHRLSLKQAQGGLDAKGTVTLKPALGWKLDATARRLDPGAFVAGWNGALDAQVATEGRMTDAGPAGSLKIAKLDGRLRDRPLHGTADLTVDANRAVTGTLAFASGDSNLAVTGRGGRSMDARVGFVLASLGDLVPQAQGRVRGTLDVKGDWPKLAVTGDVQAVNAGMGSNRVENLAADVRLTDAMAPAGGVVVTVKNATSGSLHFDTISVTANGDANRHQLSLEAAGTPLSAVVRLDGARDGATWRGTLQALNLNVKPEERWQLEQPARLEWSDARLAVTDLCLASAPARICAGGTSTADGAAEANYRIEHLQLAHIAALAAPDAPLKLTGEIAGEGSVRRDAAGHIDGQANLTSAQGSAAYPDSAQKPLLAYTDLSLLATFAPQAQNATLKLTLAGGGGIDGHIAVSGAQQQLAGTLHGSLPDLAFVELLTSDVAAVKGRAEANYDIAGTLAQPQLRGSVRVEGFAAEIPVAGLKLHDGTLTLAAASADTFQLDGTIGSGAGTVEIHGTDGTAPDAPMQVRVQGRDFLATDIPAAKVTISPDLTIERSAQLLHVTGSVEVPTADVDLTKLPNGGAAKVSPDVVIVDATTPSAKTPLPVSAEVTLRLGEKVKLKGFGLDGTLEGQIAVSDRPGKQTTGRGEIRVGGTYKAYGQDLKIQTGRLLFAGTAIDNPGLDLKAVRELKDVTAGLRVQGTAQVPVLTVFSEPAMEQAEALSYLITGRSLNALRSGEGDMVGTAARALGTATGDLLAKSVGARLGVDATVSDNNALGGAAFTVGKYLSPKLYLSYGVGVFVPGEVITLRYILSRRWNVEAQNATTSNRAGVNYRWEK